MTIETDDLTAQAFSGAPPSDTETTEQLVSAAFSEENAPQPTSVGDVPEAAATLAVAGATVDPKEEFSASLADAVAVNDISTPIDEYRFLAQRDEATFNATSFADAVRQGDADRAQFFVMKEAADREWYKNAEQYQIMKDAGRRAFLNTTVGNAVVTAINTPEKLDQASETAGNTISMMQLLAAKDIEFGELFKEAPVSTGLTFLGVALGQTVFEFGMDKYNKLVKKHFGLEGEWRTYEEAVNNLVTYLMFSQDQQGDLVRMNNMLNELGNFEESLGLGPLVAKMMVNDLIDYSPRSLRFNTVAGVLGAVGDIGAAKSIVQAVVKGGKAARMAADAGAQKKLADDIYKAVLGQDPSVPLTREVVEASLVSFSPQKLLDIGGFSGTNVHVQQKIIAAADKMVEQLKSIVVPTGKNEQEVADGLAQVLKMYSPEVNTRMWGVATIEEAGQHGIRGSYIEGSYNGELYATREVAERRAAHVGGEVIEVKPRIEDILPDEDVAKIKADIGQLSKTILEEGIDLLRNPKSLYYNPEKVDNTIRIAEMESRIAGAKSLLAKSSDPTEQSDLKLAIRAHQKALRELKDQHGKYLLEIRAENQLDSIKRDLKKAKGAAATALKKKQQEWEDILERGFKLRGHEEWLRQGLEAGTIKQTSVAEVFNGILANPEGIPAATIEVIKRIVQEGLGDERVFLSTAKAGDSPIKREGTIASYVTGADGDHIILYGPMFEKAPNRAKQAKDFLHEVIHARTAAVLSNPSVYPKYADDVAALKNLYSIVKGKANSEQAKLYGLLNEKEFIAEAFTNPEFQKFLKTVKTEFNEPSAWSRFVETMRKFFRIDKEYSSAFEDALVIGEKLLSSRFHKADSAGISADKIDGMFNSYNALVEALAKHQAAVDGITLGYGVKRTIDEPLAIGTVGKIDPNEVKTSNIVLGAFDEVHGADTQIVSARAMSVYSGAAVRDTLVNFIKPFIRDLNRKQQANLEAVLVRGNAYSNGGDFGKEFTEVELRNMGLHTDNEIAAYYAMRTLRKAMHTIRDGVMVRSMKSRGYEDFVLTMGDEAASSFSTPARVLDEAGIAAANNRKAFAFDPNDGKTRRVTIEYAAELAAEGKYLIMSPEAVEIGGKRWTIFVVDPARTIRKELTTVIPYRPGEYSRIYLDDYFIYADRAVETDGVVGEVRNHFRTARSETEAAEYKGAWNSVLAMYRGGQLDDAQAIQRLENVIGKWEDPHEVLRELREGKWDDAKGISWHYTRTPDDFTDSNISLARARGDYLRSERGAKLLPIDNHARENTLSMTDSISAELNNTASVVSLSAWRDNAVQRWFNSAKEYLPPEVQKMEPAEAFLEMEKRPFNNWSDKAELLMRRTHRYIASQLGQKSGEEQMWERLNRLIAEKFLHHKALRGTRTGEFLETVGVRLRKADKIRFFRTINTHSMLGALNPAQLIVQANSAVVAATVHPVYGAIAVKNAVPLRIALMSDNPEVWESTAKMAGILSKKDIEEFKETVRAINNTGIIRGIGSTALYNIEEGKWNVFNRVLGGAAQASLAFYNRGVEFGRLVSFQVAKSEWKAANPGKAWNTEIALHDIIRRQEVFEMNMNRATTGRFQRGAVAIPLQFMAYQLKFATNLLGSVINVGEFVKAAKTGETLEDMAALAKTNSFRQLSPKETLSVLVGTTILYGMQGNGYPDFVKEIVGDSEWFKNMSADERLYVTQGMVSGLFNSIAQLMTGEEARLAFGSRLSVLEFYNEFWNYLTGDKTVLELLSGASYSMLNTMGVVGDVFKTLKHDPHITSSDILHAVNAVGTAQIGTWRNIQKFRMYKLMEGTLHNERGDARIQATTLEQFSQLMGIGTAQQADLNTLYRFGKSRNEEVKADLELVQSLQFQRMQALIDGDKQRAEDLYKVIQVVLNGMDVEGRRLVISKYNEPTPYGTRLREAVVKYLETNLKDNDGILTTHRTLQDVNNPRENE